MTGQRVWKQLHLLFYLNTSWWLQGTPHKGLWFRKEIALQWRIYSSVMIFIIHSLLAKGIILHFGRKCEDLRDQGMRPADWIFWSTDQFPALFLLSDSSEALPLSLLLFSPLGRWCCSAEIYPQGSCGLQPQTKSQSPQVPHRHQRDRQREHPSPATLPGLQKHHLLCVERMRNTPAAALRQFHVLIDVWSSNSFRGALRSACPILQVQFKSVSVPKAGSEEWATLSKTTCCWLWLQLTLLRQWFHLVGNAFCFSWWNILPTWRFLRGVLWSKPWGPFLQHLHGVRGGMSISKVLLFSSSQDVLPTFSQAAVLFSLGECQQATQI